MTDCIIHIGMHKTGSTSIQNSLLGFSDSRFLYADLGEANHSLAMYTLFATNPENHHIHKAMGRTADSISKYIKAVQINLERAFEEAKGRTLIISGEDIGALSIEELAKLQEYIQDRVDTFSIVGYVRSPAEYQASAFQERVKHGIMKRINLDILYPNYEKKFSKFDKIFGSQNVHLWKFDPKLFPNGCVVQNFCMRLGITLPPERICRMNESLYRQAISLLFIYYKYGESYGSKTMTAPEAQILGAILARVGNDKFRFSPRKISPSLEKQRADIEWMEQRLGETLCEKLGKHQPGDVRNEQDLLNIDPQVLDKLFALLGSDAPPGVVGETPEQIARLMHALRESCYAGTLK